MYMLSSSNYKILIVQKIFYQLLCYRHILSFFQFILKTVYFNEIIQILAVEHCQRSGNNLKQHAAGRLNQHHDTLCYIFTASLLHISTYAHLFLSFGLINSEQLQIVESHRVFLSQNNQKCGEFAKVVEKAMTVKTDFQITSSTIASPTYIQNIGKNTGLSQSHTIPVAVSFILQETQPYKLKLFKSKQK